MDAVAARRKIAERWVPIITWTCTRTYYCDQGSNDCYDKPKGNANVAVPGTVHTHRDFKEIAARADFYNEWVKAGAPADGITAQIANLNGAEADARARNTGKTDDGEQVYSGAMRAECWFKVPAKGADPIKWDMVEDSVPLSVADTIDAWARRVGVPQPDLLPAWAPWAAGAAIGVFALTQVASIARIFRR